jgi:hypothetical protein
MICRKDGVVVCVPSVDNVTCVRHPRPQVKVSQVGVHAQRGPLDTPEVASPKRRPKGDHRSRVKVVLLERKILNTIFEEYSTSDVLRLHV